MRASADNDSAIGSQGRNIRQDSQEQVIRVDRNDRELGFAGKLEVHREGLLHRAFSILVFNPAGELLLQRRADLKYHFAGLWSNTCCGHPRPGEATAVAAGRRLEEEFGFSTRLSEHLTFVYRATDPVSELVEHEYLHAFRGEFNGEPQPDPAEVSAWCWMSIPEIRQRLEEGPGSFTPWFALLFQRFFEKGADGAGFASGHGLSSEEDPRVAGAQG